MVPACGGPPGLQGVPLYLCGVFPACRGCPNGMGGDLCVLLACRGRPYITLGSSWPAGGALIFPWGPPGLHCV